MEDLRDLMLTGRKAVLENGKEFLIIRDVHTRFYGFQEWALINENQFVCGSYYDGELKGSRRGFDIVAIYQGYEKDESQLCEEMLNLGHKTHLVWERGWTPKLNEKYWTVDFKELDLVDEQTYIEVYCQQRLIDRGLVFKTKEEAVEMANKMLKCGEEN